MRKRILIIGLILMAAIAVSVAVYIFATRVEARPVRLVITAPEGQRFSGSYVADGVTNTVSALAPAVLSVQARNVSFEFKREDHEPGEGEFRVALFVGDLGRTSTISGSKDGVRGALRYAHSRESYWAASFD